MENGSFVIYELPGTKISILDGLDTCGLSVINASSVGSVDIPAFDKKYLVFQEHASLDVRNMMINTIAIPDDARIIKAETAFGLVQLTNEDFFRESLELELTFESEKRGLCGANATLVTLGPFPTLREGAYCQPSEGLIQ